MGSITFTYKINPKTTPISNIISEIESGTVFAHYYDREVSIPLASSLPTDFSYNFSLNNRLILRINDSFYESDTLLDKLFTSFFMNICEYKDVVLEDIGLEDSNWRHHNSKTPVLKDFFSCFDDRPILGTIIKPYYTMNLKEKIKWIENFHLQGINLFKMDETYFLSPSQLLLETKAINAHFQGNICFVPNITHVLHDLKLVSTLINSGSPIALVNFLCSGLSSVSNLINWTDIQVWGHRIGFTYLQKKISMIALGKIASLAGISYLHIGVPKNLTECRNKQKLIENLKTNNRNILPIFTKTTPEVLGHLLETFGNNAIYMGCGFFYQPNGQINWNRVREWVKVCNE